MKNRMDNAEILKKLICDAVQDIPDSGQLRRIYSAICRQHKAANPMIVQIQEIAQKLSSEDLRLLYIAALELQKGGK